MHLKQNTYTTKSQNKTEKNIKNYKNQQLNKQLAFNGKDISHIQKANDICFDEDEKSSSIFYDQEIFQDEAIFSQHQEPNENIFQEFSSNGSQIQKLIERKQSISNLMQKWDMKAQLLNQNASNVSDVSNQGRSAQYTPGAASAVAFNGASQNQHHTNQIVISNEEFGKFMKIKEKLKKKIFEYDSQIQNILINFRSEASQKLQENAQRIQNYKNLCRKHYYRADSYKTKYLANEFELKDRVTQLYQAMDQINKQANANEELRYQNKKIIRNQEFKIKEIQHVLQKIIQNKFQSKVQNQCEEIINHSFSEENFFLNNQYQNSQNKETIDQQRLHNSLGYIKQNIKNQKVRNGRQNAKSSPKKQIEQFKILQSQEKQGKHFFNNQFYNQNIDRFFNWQTQTIKLNNSYDQGKYLIQDFKNMNKKNKESHKSKKKQDLNNENHKDLNLSIGNQIDQDKSADGSQIQKYFNQLQNLLKQLKSNSHSKKKQIRNQLSSNESYDNSISLSKDQFDKSIFSNQKINQSGQKTQVIRQKINNKRTPIFDQTMSEIKSSSAASSSNSVNKGFVFYQDDEQKDDYSQNENKYKQKKIGFLEQNHLNDSSIKESPLFNNLNDTSNFINNITNENIQHANYVKDSDRFFLADYNLAGQPLETKVSRMQDQNQTMEFDVSFSKELAIATKTGELHVIDEQYQIFRDSQSEDQFTQHFQDKYIQNQNQVNYVDQDNFNEQYMQKHFKETKFFGNDTNNSINFSNLINQINNDSNISNNRFLQNKKQKNHLSKDQKNHIYNLQKNEHQQIEQDYLNANYIGGSFAFEQKREALPHNFQQSDKNSKYQQNHELVLMDESPEFIDQKILINQFDQNYEQKIKKQNQPLLMKFNLINNEKNKKMNLQIDDNINQIDLSSIILAVSDSNLNSQKNIKSQMKNQNFKMFDNQINQNYEFEEMGIKKLFNQTQKHNSNILAKVDEINHISEIKNTKILCFENQQSQPTLNNNEQEIGNFSSVNSKFFTEEMKDLHVALNNGKLLEKNNYGEIYNIVNISKDDAESIINLLRDYVVVQIGNGKEIKIPKLDLGVLPNDFPDDIKNEINNKINNMQYILNPSALSELTDESNQQKDTKIEGSDEIQNEATKEFCDLLNQSFPNQISVMHNKNDSYKNVTTDNKNQSKKAYQENQIQGISSAYQQIQQINKSSFNNTTTQEEPMTITGNENSSIIKKLKKKSLNNKKQKEIFQIDNNSSIQYKKKQILKQNVDDETDFVELISDLNSSKLNKNFEKIKSSYQNYTSESNEELNTKMQMKIKNKVKGNLNVDTYQNSILKGPEIFFNGESPINSFIPTNNFFNKQNQNILINDEKNQYDKNNFQNYNKMRQNQNTSDQIKSQFSKQIMNEQIMPFSIENDQNFLINQNQIYKNEEQIFQEIEDQEIFKDMNDLQNMKNVSNVVVSNLSKNYYLQKQEQKSGQQNFNKFMYNSQNKQNISELNEMMENIYNNENNCVNSFEQTYNQDFVKDMTNFDYNSNLSKSIASAGYAENLESSLCLNHLEEINLKNKSRQKFINNFANGKFKGQCFLDITNQGIVFPDNFLIDKESLGSQLGGNSKGKKQLDAHRIPTKRMNSGKRFNHQKYNACNDTGNLKQLLEQSGFQNLNGTIQNKRGCFNFEQALQNISHISMQEELANHNDCKTQRLLKNQKKYQEKQKQKSKLQINNINVQKSLKVKQNQCLLPKSPTSSVGQGHHFDFQNKNQEKIYKQRNLKSQQNSNVQSIKISQRVNDIMNIQDSKNINGLNSPHKPNLNSQGKDLVQNKAKSSQQDQSKKPRQDQMQQQKTSKKSVKSITPSFGVGAIVKSVGSSRTQKIIVSQTTKNNVPSNRKVKVNIQKNNYILQPKPNTNEGVFLNIPGTTKSYQSQQSQGSTSFNKMFKNSFKKKEVNEMNKISRTNNTVFNDGKDYASLQSICKQDVNQNEQIMFQIAQKFNQVQDTLASVQSQRTNRSFKSQISQKGIRQLKNFNKNQSKVQSQKSNFMMNSQQTQIETRNYTKDQKSFNSNQQFNQENMAQENNLQKNSIQKNLGLKVLSARYISQPQANSNSENIQNYQSVENPCQSNIQTDYFINKQQNTKLKIISCQNVKKRQSQQQTELNLQKIRSEQNNTSNNQQVKNSSNQSYKNEKQNGFYSHMPENKFLSQINDNQNIYQMKIQSNQNFLQNQINFQENLNQSILSKKNQKQNNQFQINKQIQPSENDFNIDMYENEKLRANHQPLIGVKKVPSTQVTGRASDNIIKIQKNSIFRDSLNNVVIKDLNPSLDNQEPILKEQENDTKKMFRQSISLNQQAEQKKHMEIPEKKSNSQSLKDQNKKTINIKNLISQSKNKRITVEQTEITSQGHSSSKFQMQNISNQVNLDSNNKKMNSIKSLEQKYKISEASISQQNQGVNFSQITNAVDIVSQDQKIQSKVKIQPFQNSVQTKLKGTNNNLKIQLVNRQEGTQNQKKGNDLNKDEDSIKFKISESQNDLFVNNQYMVEQKSLKNIDILNKNQDQFQYFSSQENTQKSQSHGLQKVLKQNLLKLQKAQNQLSQAENTEQIPKKIITQPSDKRSDENQTQKKTVLQIRSVNSVGAKGKSVGASQNQIQQKHITQTHSSSAIRLNQGNIQAIKLLPNYIQAHQITKVSNGNKESDIDSIAGKNQGKQPNNIVKSIKPAKIKLTINREQSIESQKSIENGTVKVLENFTDQKYHSTQKRTYQQNAITGIPSNTTLNSNQIDGETRANDSENLRQQSINSYQNSSKLGILVNNQQTAVGKFLNAESNGLGQNITSQQPMKKALLIKQLLFKQQQRLNINIGQTEENLLNKNN